MNKLKYHVGFNQIVEAQDSKEAVALAQQLMYSENACSVREATPLLVSAQAAFLAVREKITDWQKEHLLVALLNTRLELQEVHLASIGILDSCIAHPRELFAQAITTRAKSIILVHNHPSGDLSPSQEDLALTKRMVAAGKLLNIPVTDHVIISRYGYYSLLEHGQL